HHHVLPTAGVQNAGFRKAESLSDWQRHIEWLAEAVKIWDAVQKNNRQILADRFRWVNEDEGIVRYFAAGQNPWTEYSEFEQRTVIGWDVIGDAPNGAALRRTIATGDVLVPAKLYVLTLLNRELRTLVGPVLLMHAQRSEVVRQDMPASLLG